MFRVKRCFPFGTPAVRDQLSIYHSDQFRFTHLLKLYQDRLIYSDFRSKLCMKTIFAKLCQKNSLYLVVP